MSSGSFYARWLQCEGSQRSIGKAPGLQRPRPYGEIRASILRKLDIIEAAEVMKDAPLPDFMR